MFSVNMTLDTPKISCQLCLPGEEAAGGGGQGGEDREGGREAARQQDEGKDGDHVERTKSSELF